MPPPVPCISALHCYRAPLPLLASLHSTKPCSELELPLQHPAVRCRRTLLCLLPTPASQPHAQASIMVHTREAHRYRPRVQFSTPEREGAGISRAAAAHSPAQVTETPLALAPAIAMIQGLAPASISEEAQASEPPSRRYQTRVGPRPPSSIHLRPPQRASPSKRARKSGLSESSRSRPEPTPPPAAPSSSPPLSPASRIRRPIFSCDLIPGNVNLHARDFHRESYYDIPVLTADQRFRDSMRLIQRYSLLPFMTPRQFFFLRVVLDFYHTLTSWGAPSQLQLQFSIDGHLGVLRVADITAALGLQVVLANSADYRQWPQSSPREMVRSLARDTTVGPILFLR